MTHDECAAYDVWRRDPINSIAMAELWELWAALEDVRRDSSPTGNVSKETSLGRTREIARSARAVALFGAAWLVFGLMRGLDSPWMTNLDWWSR